MKKSFVKIESTICLPFEMNHTQLFVRYSTYLIISSTLARNQVSIQAVISINPAFDIVLLTHLNPNSQHRKRHGVNRFSLFRFQCKSLNLSN